MSSKQVVSKDMIVSLDYVLTLDNGEEIDRSDENAPLEYLHGHGNIIPGLENELQGLTTGDEKNVVVQPEHGYGERNPESIAEYPRNAFPDTVKLEVGEPIGMRDSESGEAYQAYVSEVRPETIVLDFNHPLAGEILFFKIKIAGLREPTGEELSHGHVHHPGHGH